MGDDAGRGRFLQRAATRVAEAPDPRAPQKKTAPSDVYNNQGSLKFEAGSDDEVFGTSGVWRSKAQAG